MLPLHMTGNFFRFQLVLATIIIIAATSCNNLRVRSTMLPILGLHLVQVPCVEIQ